MSLVSCVDSSRLVNQYFSSEAIAGNAEIQENNSNKKRQGQPDAGRNCLQRCPLKEDDWPSSWLGVDGMEWMEGWSSVDAAGDNIIRWTCSWHYVLD